MNWQFQILVALLLCALAGTAVLEYNNAIQKAEHAEAAAFADRRALEESKAAFAVLKHEFDIQEAILLEKQGYEEAIRKKLSGVHVRLDRLRIADPVVQEWSSTPLPPGVRRILHEDRDPVRRPGDVHPPVGGADRTNAGAAPAAVPSGR